MTTTTGTPGIPVAPATAGPANEPVTPEASLNCGVIGNCSYNALVDKSGNIVWSCLPRFDGDPVFNALLDNSDHGSVWSIELENCVKTEQFYDPNTAVLRTRLTDADNHGIEITDFAPRFLSRDRMFRPLMLIRRIRMLNSAVRIRVRVRPRFDWGRITPQITRGSHHIRYVGPEQTLRLNTDASLSHLLSESWFLINKSLNFTLGPDETLNEGIEDICRRFEKETVNYWRNWSRRLALPYEYQDVVIRAAITLKMSLYEDTGAIIAAMTTSIPEAPGSARNWDYRFCWLRDAFFVVRALNSLSEVGTMEEYLRWLSNIVASSKGGHIQPLYGIGLEEHLPESTLDHLPGYRGHKPVRVGNQAQEHFQHDVYGNVVLGAAQAFLDHRLLNRAGVAEFAMLEAVGEQAFRVHDQPDAGMWELRTRVRPPLENRPCAGAAGTRRVLAGPRRPDPRTTAARLVERGAPGVCRKPGRPRSGCQRAADGGSEFHRSDGSALHQDCGSTRENPVRRSVHAPLRSARRFRQAGNRVQHLHLLAYRRAGAHRPQGRSARNLRDHAQGAQPPRAAVGRHAPGYRRNVGQLPADVLDGGADQLRDASVGALG
jgi:hypothetical protein